MQTFLLLSMALSLVDARRSKITKRDTVISTSVRDPAYSRSFGTLNQLTTVNPGVYVWLSGGGTHNFYGNLDNSGLITISQTDYIANTGPIGGQTADFTGSTTTNGNLNNRAGAVISLNDFGSTSAPTYDWYLNTMQNDGSLQWCGRGDTGGSTYQLYCRQTCTNNGVIDFQQYNDNIGAAFVWRNNAITTTGNVFVYNNGAFRLRNVVFHNVQNIYGTGCWVIDVGGVLYLEDGTGAFQNPTAGPSFPGQSIYFPTSGSGDIHMDTAVYSRNPNFGAQVYNFAQGSAIEFYETVQSQAYDASTGILRINLPATRYVNINIGLGYTASLFSIARNPSKYNTAGYTAVFYNGPAPAQAVPGVCQVSLQNCGDPALTALGQSTSSTSTTAAPTSTSTDAGVTTTTPGVTTTTANTSANTTPTPSTPGNTLPITCTCPSPSVTVTVTGTA